MDCDIGKGSSIGARGDTLTVYFNIYRKKTLTANVALNHGR